MAHSTDFVIENGVLVKYTGTDAAVTTPDGVFWLNENITSVIIPDGVTEIGSDAFRECCALTMVRLSATLAKVWFAAFSDCEELFHVQFPADRKAAAKCLSTPDMA